MLRQPDVFNKRPWDRTARPQKRPPRVPFQRPAKYRSPTIGCRCPLWATAKYGVRLGSSTRLGSQINKSRVRFGSSEGATDPGR